MDEAEGLASVVSQATPVGERNVEHRVGADDIGRYKRVRGIDRPVHVAFRGKMDNRVGLERVRRFRDRLAIADVGLTQTIAGVLADGLQCLRACRISQLVDVQNLMSVLAYQ